MVPISIIVLCYNSLKEATIPCLESVIANTSSDYELIIVDNASTDGTRTYLTTLAKRHNHIRIQLNDTNRGFAGGNNDGIKMARGEFIVLLNNDTLVPSGWLDSLQQVLTAHPEVGMIGPITNFAGNEQRIELNGLNEHNYEEISGSYIERQKGEWFTTEKLGFFCVMIRKDVIEKIGLLDECFGIGMFEDDDFCLRTKQAGFKLAVAEDSFVYHKGSLSFKKISDKKYVDLFNRNRKYYFEKHGELWKYSDITNATWQRLKADLEYCDSKTCTIALERVRSRISNMTDAIYQIQIAEDQHITSTDKAIYSIKLKDYENKLMEMSEWAAKVKHDNERLTEELKEKHSEMMELSDWADKMNNQIQAFSQSKWYKLYRKFNRKKAV